MVYVNDVANLELAAETCELARAKGAQAEVLPFNVAACDEVSARHGHHRQKHRPPGHPGQQCRPRPG